MALSKENGDASLVIAIPWAEFTALSVTIMQFTGAGG